jgi:hypothetical protein
MKMRQAITRAKHQRTELRISLYAGRRKRKTASNTHEQPLIKFFGEGFDMSAECRPANSEPPRCACHASFLDKREKGFYLGPTQPRDTFALLQSQQNSHRRDMIVGEFRGNYRAMEIESFDERLSVPAQKNVRPVRLLLSAIGFYPLESSMRICARHVTPMRKSASDEPRQLNVRPGTGAIAWARL